MSVDTTLIGETAAQLMDLIPEDDPGTISAVGIIAIVDCDDGTTNTLVKFSHEQRWQQLGIISAGHETLLRRQPDDA